jgi:hypothetical protein
MTLPFRREGHAISERLFGVDAVLFQIIAPITFTGNLGTAPKQNGSKLADMLVSASALIAFVGIALNVVRLVMALLPL